MLILLKIMAGVLNALISFSLTYLVYAVKYLRGFFRFLFFQFRMSARPKTKTFFVQIYNRTDTLIEGK